MTPPKANKGSAPSRGRTSWPRRGGQSVRGRGTFQSRERTQPATLPPSPRLASQNNRLPTADRPSSVVAVVDAVVSVGYANAKDVLAGTILRWRTASHLHRKMNVRHHVVQHRQGRVVTSVAPLDATPISAVEMHEMSTFLHRSSQVKYSYLSWSR